MSFTDKELRCFDCGNTFIFDAGEQEFFASKGFTNEPKRCPDCRSTRKTERNGGQARRMYPAVCAACGTDTEVPFEPRLDKPVYCSQCYSTTGSARRR